jgi:hypothetical protein
VIQDCDDNNNNIIVIYGSSRGVDLNVAEGRVCGGANKKYDGLALVPPGLWEQSDWWMRPCYIAQYKSGSL